jgi:hypothetical protein
MAPIGNVLARAGKRAEAVTLGSAPDKENAHALHHLRPRPVIEFILTFFALPIATLAIWVVAMVVVFARLLERKL